MRTRLLHKSDDQPTQSVGAIAVAPSDPNVIYVGTGEGNLRGNVTWGGGVFKSTDGGLTWTQSLTINADTGVVDLAMDPGDPNTLYAAGYEMRRDGFAGGDPGKRVTLGGGLRRTI